MHVKSNFEFFTHELQDSAMTRWQGQNISTSKVQTPASVTLAAAVFSRKSWQIESSCVPNGLVVESGRKKPWLRDSTRSESYAGLGDSWHVLIYVPRPQNDDDCGARLQALLPFPLCPLYHQ